MKLSGLAVRAVVGLLQSVYGLTASVVSGVINTVVTGKLIVRLTGGTAGSQEAQLFHDGTDVYLKNPITNGPALRLTNGNKLKFVASSSVEPFIGDLSGWYLISSSKLLWSSGTSFADATNDTGLARTAAGVVAATLGTSGSGWLQNTAGRSRVTTSDVTNATVTPANITGLTATLIAGRKYSGRLCIFCSDSAAADGILFDFDGGTATWTSFRAAIVANVQGATLGVTQSTAIATDLTATAMNGTGQHYIVIEFAGVCNAAGTFIPRMAQNAHSAGTASVHVDSFMWLEDMP